MLEEPTPISIAKKSLVNRVITDGLRLGLGCHFVQQADFSTTAWMKDRGADWFALRRMWMMSVEQFRERVLPDALALDLVEWTAEDVRDLAVTAWKNPESDFFSSLLDVQLFPVLNEAQEVTGLAVTTHYDRWVIEVLRKFGGIYHPHAKLWQLRGHPDRIQAALLYQLTSAAGVAADYIFVHQRPISLEKLIAKQQSEIRIHVPAAMPDGLMDAAASTEQVGRYFVATHGMLYQPMTIDASQLERLANYGLYDYQPAGVKHLLSQSSALLADDMGLGKSRQATVAADLAADARHKILVVCPASLRINWQREIHAVCPDATIAMVGQCSLDELYQSRWLIANYERLAGLVREVDLPIAVMMIDEAHYLKEYQAGRTRHAFVLADRIPRRYLLTATPLLSREDELHTLLRLSGHGLGRLSLKDFRDQFSGSADKRAALLPYLNGWMLRRSKSVLKNLGIKTIQPRWIEPEGGLASYQAIYHDMTLQVMPKITKLRQHLELLKMTAAIEVIQSLQAEDKLIIFCEYMDTVALLKEALKALKIGFVSLVGADALNKRMKAVDDFQSDAAIKVFIGTTAAAGVGWNLTAANYVLFMTLPWTPAVMRQAEDRAYRNGNIRDVLVIVLLIAQTLDEQVWQLLQAKRDIETAIVDEMQQTV